MGELAGTVWLIALAVLIGCICLTVILGLGALIGLVEGHYLSMVFGFTWRLWLGWLAATFLGLGIAYYNSRNYLAASRG